MSSQSLCLWHHMQYMWHHIHSLWLHTIEVITLHPVHSCHHTPNIWRNTYGNTNVISAFCPTVSNTPSTLSLSSNPGYQLYHTHSLYDITNYTCDIIFSMYTIDDITATTWKVLHEVYLWYHIPYVFDKISTKYDITTLCVDVTTLGICLASFALQMTSHPLYHTKQRYLWCHIHFTHHITPQYQTLHPLYLCHHKLSTDIWPTFELQNTHVLCDILCPI